MLAIVPDVCSRSPAGSPDPATTKLASPVSGRTPEQKPFRGFDITSLIRKDDTETAAAKTAASPEAKVVTSPTPTSSSPTLSRGPPIEKSSNPYAGLFGSGLYHQYLGHILSSQQQGGQAPAPPSPAPFPPFNPMLLQAQLAMAAQAQSQAQAASLLGSYPGVASSMLAERLKQQRFAPYSRISPSSSLNSSMHSPNSSSGPSAFRSLTPKSVSSPPVSPPSQHSPSPTSTTASPATSPTPAVKLEPKNDIKNIESMIQGLNGSAEGRFSLSHDVK